MNFEEFHETLLAAEPPLQISRHLLSLWYDAKDDWEKSHTIIQDINDAEAAWVHAYLHRKEGDNGNADYWYRRAGKRRPAISFDEEWKLIVKALLNEI